MNKPTKPMPLYRCHKQVWALRIEKIELDVNKAHSENRDTDGSATITPSDEGHDPFTVDRHFLRKHDPQVGGYYVVYDDDYESYSPASAFESGYTLIT